MTSLRTHVQPTRTRPAYAHTPNLRAHPDPHRTDSHLLPHRNTFVRVNTSEQASAGERAHVRARAHAMDTEAHVYACAHAHDHDHYLAHNKIWRSLVCSQCQASMATPVDMRMV
eukprot:4096680-Pleurochrysis_carterae.AAC.1